jgi:hypothetical protein
MSEVVTAVHVQALFDVCLEFYPIVANLFYQYSLRT